jgi:hypothetical protein
LHAHSWPVRMQASQPGRQSDAWFPGFVSLIGFAQCGATLAGVDPRLRSVSPSGVGSDGPARLRLLITPGRSHGARPVSRHASRHQAMRSPMKKILSAAFAATFIVFGYPTLADDVKDVKKAIDKAKDWSKKAADDAADWSKKAADDTAKGTKKAADSAKDWSKKATDDTSRATKKAADDTADPVKNAGK